MTSRLQKFRISNPDFIDLGSVTERILLAVAVVAGALGSVRGRRESHRLRNALYGAAGVALAVITLAFVKRAWEARRGSASEIAASAPADARGPVDTDAVENADRFLPVDQLSNDAANAAEFGAVDDSGTTSTANTAAS